ncbi:MAG: 50S ribosomal protein L24 [bacterium]|nr:50S ribosomal protein L24 [bacterium]
MKIKKGDTIIVITGKDKKRTGKVDRVYPKSQKLVIENINMYKRHVKKSEQSPNGGFVEVARPIQSSKVMFECPKCKKPSRLGYEIIKGTKKRICKKCGKNV